MYVWYLYILFAIKLQPLSMCMGGCVEYKSTAKQNSMYKFSMISFSDKDLRTSSR